MKKLCILLSLVLLLTLLVACGSEQVAAPPLGTWENNIFSNEYLGFRFVLPADWMTFSETDITAQTGELPDEVGVFDMLALNIFSGDSVLIRHTWLGGRDQLSADEIREAIREDIGWRAEFDSTETTRIGLFDWESFVDLDFPEFHRHFATFQNGFLSTITITTNPESLSDILSSFIGLTDPLPAPPQAEPSPQTLPPLDSSQMEHAEELVGTWAWDTDETFIYIFHADGQGTRGFQPQKESFSWWAAADGGLAIILEDPLPFQIAQEEWDYTIAEGILTISSRQIPDLVFSYIAQ